jgi:hypothetical protein
MIEGIRIHFRASGIMQPNLAAKRLSFSRVDDKEAEGEEGGE